MQRGAPGRAVPCRATPAAGRLWGIRLTHLGSRLERGQEETRITERGGRRERRRTMQLRAIMTPEVEVIHPEATLQQVAYLGPADNYLVPKTG